MSEVRQVSATQILPPLSDFDPRDRLDGTALIEASRNAYPMVAAATPKRDSLGLVTGGGIAAALGLLTFWSMSGNRSPAPAPKTATPAVVAPTNAQNLPVAVTPVPASSGSLVFPHTQPWAQILPAPIGSVGERTRAPVMVFDASGAPVAEVPAGLGTTPPAPGFGSTPQHTPVAGELSDNEQFASRIGAGSGQVATAEQLSNPASTVAQGTLIAGVLETAINTDLPGYVRALVSRDVRSFDGSQVLIPRSSRLIGQYKSGLSQGQTRAYVIWTRLIRPDGVSVMLDSPGVDFAGTAGFAGKVNSHFMKRFGSALLLSVVGGLSSLGSGGAGVVVGGGGQSAASVAAGRDGAIAPTIRVAQGEPIRIFTARDLDFSTAPSLEARR